MSALVALMLSCDLQALGLCVAGRSRAVNNNSDL